MYSYIKGIITMIEPGGIVVEAGGVGYMIYVSNPYSYKVGNETTIYIYQQVREDDNTLYGFKSVDDKNMFLKLISVKGLGCKMALPMLSGDNMNEIYAAIETGNINYLKKFPKIGDKVARQIILDLKGKLTIGENIDKKDYTELTETLKVLGYKPVNINKILPGIHVSKSLEEQVKEALKLLLR